MNTVMISANLVNRKILYHLIYHMNSFFMISEEKIRMVYDMIYLTSSDFLVVNFLEIKSCYGNQDGIHLNIILIAKKWLGCKPKFDIFFPILKGGMVVERAINKQKNHWSISVLVSNVTKTLQIPCKNQTSVKTDVS